MQVSVENTGDIGRRMTVSVPANEVEDKVKGRLKHLAKTVRIPGFRPGKVPANMVESRFGGQVMQEVVGEVIQNSYRDALAQEGLSPVALPEIEPKSMTRGQDLEYVATFEVFPKITTLDLSGQKIETPKVEVAEEDVDRTLERMREREVMWNDTEAAAKSGDRLIIDFEGKIEGEPFEGNHAKDFQLVLGSGEMLKDFDKGLTGAKAGDELTVNVDFPEDYPGAEVVGKTAIFSVQVKEVANPEFPEIDDDFAIKLGVEEGGVKKLRKEVRENLQRELDDRLRSHVRFSVMEKLLEVNEFPVPQRLIEEEINSMVASLKEELERRGLGDKAQEIDRSKHEPEARRRVALGLILQEVVKTNGIRPDPDRVHARIDKIAQSYEKPDEFVQWYYGERERVAQLENAALEEQVVEKLLEGAEIVETPKSFQAFMDPGPEQAA